MSSRPSAPVVDVELRPSRVLSLFVTAVTVLAATAVYFSGVANMVKAVLVSGILLSGGFWVADRGLRLMSFSLVRAVFMQGDECILVDRRGRTRSCVMKDGLQLGRYIAFVMLGDTGWRTPVLCMAADGVDAEPFRRVRMRLRMIPARPSAVASVLRRGIVCMKRPEHVLEN